MKILRGLHTGYGLIVFIILFILFFPLFLVPIIWPKRFQWVGILNRWWARLLFFLVGVPFRVAYRSKLNPRGQYIFAPNHFSYLDIPTLGLNHYNTIFVGKNDMENIPVFGFMYRKLHITVDREKLKSRSTTIQRSLRAVDEGKSLVIFPEGGIVTARDPVMGKFKDGAFRVAIEKQIPIVPVTIPYNWIILPPNEFLLYWHPLKVTFHEPIDTRGMTMNDLGKLKEQVFRIIEEELAKAIKQKGSEVIKTS